MPGEGDEPTLKELAWDIATQILKEEHFVTIGENSKIIYHYEDGIYVPNGRGFVEKKVQELCEDKTEVSTHLVNEVLGHLQRETYRKEGLQIFEEKNPHLVLENCLLNLQTLETEPFSPDYYALVKMPVKYDPSAEYKKSKFWKVLNELLTPDEITGLQEELGRILSKNPAPKKLSIWEGETDTGKTTILTVFQTLLGENGYSSVPLQRLSENDRFSVACLFGKMANIVDDMPRDIIRSVGKLKDITGGGKAVHAEQKFHDPFQFRNYAFLISVCNKLPLIEEDDDAFWNRVILRPFRQKIPPEKQNKSLPKELTTPEELSAVLNFGLEGLKRLKENGWHFSKTKTIEETRENYKKRSDPIWAFATYCLDTSDSDAYEVKEELYNAFRDYCELENLPNQGKDYFYKHLGDKISVTSGRRGERGSQKHCFIGVRLKPKEEWILTHKQDLVSVHKSKENHDYHDYGNYGNSNSKEISSFGSHSSHSSTYSYGHQSELEKQKQQDFCTRCGRQPAASYVRPEGVFTYCDECASKYLDKL
jgi:putative DNA primase/helicase